CREVIDSNTVVNLQEGPRGTGKTVVADLDPAVVTIEKVERLQNQIELKAIADKKAAGKAHVGGGVVGSDEGVASPSREAIVGVVAVAIGIAGDARVNRAPAAHGEYVGDFPIVEDLPQKIVPHVKGMRLDYQRESQAMTLIGDAGGALA